MQRNNKLTEKKEQSLLGGGIDKINKQHKQGKISKEVRDNKTYTLINKLDYNSRLQEISKMISAKNVTDEALILAERLLSS